MKFPLPRNLLMAMLLLSTPAFGAVESDPVTADNWLNHPRTKAVRDIYKSVEDGISSGRFKLEPHVFKLCVPFMDASAAINIGADSRIRKYYYEAGSDYSTVKVSHYYDDRGILRFVSVSAGAVNNTVVEYRIYFDEGGERFWHDRRRVTGPGHFFTEIWPEEGLVREPRASSDGGNGCPNEQ